MDNEALTATSEINSSNLQAVISNLINNSVESITDNGYVNVYLSIRHDILQIKIQDNGCGIPELILQKVKQGGVTTKTNGCGIGLSSSINFIKSWNGNLDIYSKENEGTTITIKLPASEPPTWLPHNIQIQKNSSLVILDDDESIHDVMRHKLTNIIKPEYEINVVHFKCPNKFIEFYSSFNKSNKIYFFFDYELIGSDMTGIDLIHKYNLKNNSTLVTSRFDDMAVQDKCKLLNIKILPKNIAYFIPIEII